MTRKKPTESMDVCRTIVDLRSAHVHVCFRSSRMNRVLWISSQQLAKRFDPVLCTSVRNPLQCIPCINSNAIGGTQRDHPKTLSKCRSYDLVNSHCCAWGSESIFHHRASERRTVKQEGPSDLPQLLLLSTSALLKRDARLQPKKEAKKSLSTPE